MTKRGHRLLAFFSASPEKAQTAVSRLPEDTDSDDVEAEDLNEQV
ncbi:hypothetical protein [Rhizobium sp. BE258]|nr:hypothetical protein [Rhizobium sp. BE258]MDR7145229.1 hypothetical protein [Rhizobium sp. BE258]